MQFCMFLQQCKGWQLTSVKISHVTLKCMTLIVLDSAEAIETQTIIIEDLILVILSRYD